MADAYAQFVQSQARLARVKAANEEQKRVDKIAGANLALDFAKTGLDIRKGIVENSMLDQKTASGAQMYQAKASESFPQALRKAILPTKKDFELTSVARGEKADEFLSTFNPEVAGEDLTGFKVNRVTDKMNDLTSRSGRGVGLTERGTKGKFSLQKAADRPAIEAFGKEMAEKTSKIASGPKPIDVAGTNHDYLVESIIGKGREINSGAQVSKAGGIGRSLIDTSDKMMNPIKDAIAPVTEKISMLTDKIPGGGAAISGVIAAGSRLSKGYIKNPFEREKANQDLASTAFGLSLNAVPVVGNVASALWFGARGIKNLFEGR